MENSEKEVDSRETNVKALIQKFQKGLNTKSQDYPTSANLNNSSCRQESSNSHSERQTVGVCYYDKINQRIL
jgi:hypothetical protein